MKYSLNTKDFLRGLFVSVGTAALVVIQSSLSAGSLVFDWKNIGIAAAAAATAYLLKNYFTDDVKVAKTTLKDAAVDTAESRKVDQIETKK